MVWTPRAPGRGEVPGQLVLPIQHLCGGVCWQCPFHAIPGSRLPRLGAGEPRGGGGQAGGPSGCHGELGRAGAECRAQSCRAQVLTTEGVLFQQARVSVSPEAGVCTHLTWGQGAECGPDPCSCTAAPATTGRERVLLRTASPGSRAWCNHSLPKGMPPPLKNSPSMGRMSICKLVVCKSSRWKKAGGLRITCGS